MAKNGNFFMEFWPTFDIFHRLRPHLCSKREVLGFHKQVTYMRPGDEPFFYFRVHQSWLGSAEKWSIFDNKKNQTWQACSWLNQTKWKRFNGPYDIYIDRKTCVGEKGRKLCKKQSCHFWSKWTILPPPHTMNRATLGSKIVWNL